MSLTFKESSHRYTLDGQHVTGVTTIIKGGIPAPALVWWAGGVVAKWAMDPTNDGKLAELKAGEVEAGVKFLQMLPNRERDEAGENGTAVHDMAERLIQDGTVKIPAEFAHLASHVEGYADFLDAWQITPVLVERILANRKHWYSGKFDLYATSPLLMSKADIAAGKVVQIDLKTSKGVYGETALQTAAYARAEFYMDDHGNESPLPEVVKTFVAHVTPNERESEVGKRYEGWPLGTSLYQLAGSPAEIDQHFEMFLHAKAVKDDAKARDSIIGEPLQLPAIQDVAA